MGVETHDLATRNITFCQGQNPCQKDKIPGKRDICEGKNEGQMAWQKRSSQTLCQGLHPWQKNEGLNPWQIAMLSPWHVPSLSSAASCTSDYDRRLTEVTSHNSKKPGTCEGFNPCQMSFFFFKILFLSKRIFFIN
ncbi:hypothetical protein MTR_4g047975 [Medicago truncatula]|uniref:Uncharacterized protein n=1 Tax=Medicago truncatula TaxID=3880 RepID=A0A072UUW8_MEDTR|nr:hypothetical protein MTR_4g047975 [Medicago truncatula]